MERKRKKLKRETLGNIKRKDFSLRMLFEHKLKKLVVTDSHRVSIKHFGESGRNGRKGSQLCVTPNFHLLTPSTECLREGKIHIRYQFLLCWQFFSCSVFYQTSINMCLFEVDKQCTEETWRSEKLCKFSLCLRNRLIFLLCCHVLNGDTSDYGVTF